MTAYFTHMPRPDFRDKVTDLPKGAKPEDARYWGTIQCAISYGTAEDVLFKRVRSTIFIAALPPQDSQRINDYIRQLMASEPAMPERDSISVLCPTAAFVAQKAAWAGI